MATPVESPSSHLDFSGLGRLRAKARTDSPAAAREIGQQFEAMFVQMMLKSMREASPRSGFMQSPAMDTYQDMYDKEISIHLGRRGVLGIGEVLTKAMENAQGKPAKAEDMIKPAGMAAGSGRGLPLVREQVGVPLHHPQRALPLPQPKPAGGFPLTRVEPRAAAAAAVAKPDQP